MFATAGRKLHPAVILIHGFGSSLHTWEPWARALQSDYRVIRFDLPGSGLSEPDPTGRYDDASTMELIVCADGSLGRCEGGVRRQFDRRTHSLEIRGAAIRSG